MSCTWRLHVMHWAGPCHAPGCFMSCRKQEKAWEGAGRRGKAGEGVGRRVNAREGLGTASLADAVLGSSK